MVGPAGRYPYDMTYWGIFQIVALIRLVYSYFLMKEVLFVTDAI